MEQQYNKSMQRTIQLTILEGDEEKLLGRQQEILDTIAELPFPILVDILPTEL